MFDTINKINTGVTILFLDGTSLHTEERVFVGKVMVMVGDDSFELKKISKIKRGSDLLYYHGKEKFEVAKKKMFEENLKERKKEKELEKARKEKFNNSFIGKIINYICEFIEEHRDRINR